LTKYLEMHAWFLLSHIAHLLLKVKVKAKVAWFAEKRKKIFDSTLSKN